MKPVFIFLFSLITVAMYGQDNAKLYFLNKDWTPAENMELATYIMHMVKESDSVYSCRYYRTKGPMIKWETFRDSSLEIPNGRFAWYNEKGRIDSFGTVAKGKKDKNWFYNIDENDHASIEEYFENGRLKNRTNYVLRTVTLANGFTESLDKSKTPDAVAAKINTAVQRTPEFVGGISSWSSYMAQNLHPPKRLLELSGSNAIATVVVEFTVSKTGKVDGLFIWRSYEWSADFEAMRVIQAGPDWKPAEQDGKPVVYRHRQSITYRMGF